MVGKIKDIELPKTLYKYRDWNNKNHRRLISHQEIYLSKPSDFNDPFDGNIPVRWDLLTYEDCFKKNLEIINIKHKDKDQEQVRAYAKKVTDEKTLWHPDKLVSERPEQLSDWNNRIGLCSLSSVNDNILMWSHYSRNHTGFVVGFDSNTLSTLDELDYLERVNYQKDYPIISGFDDLTTQFYKKFFYKSQLWEYESEWRVSKNHIENRILRLPKNSITEILVGCCFGGRELNKFIKLTTKYLGKEIPIYKTVKLVDEFGLRKERIQ